MSGIILEDSDFKQAEAILNDVLFVEHLKAQQNKTAKDVAALKLFEARKENIDFDLELAERICGDHESYPYRSSFFLTKFFQDLGYSYSHSGETRRNWVADVLKELDVKELVNVIESGLFRKKDYKNPYFWKSVESKKEPDERWRNALAEFPSFINDSIRANETASIVDIFGQSINIELLFETEANTMDKELNDLIEEAKRRFFTPGDKLVAVQKLWDAFERIKTYFDSGSGKAKSADKVISIVSGEINEDLFQEEFRTLTSIGNQYRIRHHETDKLEIKDDTNLNYLFFRMLALISLCLVSLKEHDINQ